ncbi:MAG: OadG family protein [Oscillospiraceae bacterium]|nr:OadG family protein [Oscillospiraceae bacterium]
MTYLASQNTADLVDITLPNAGIVAVLGYAVVFVGLIALMIVVILLGKAFSAAEKKGEAPEAAPAPAAAPAPVAAPVVSDAAPGTAGQLKLYDTPPKTAAMIMAIVAEKMGKPLNELRFISIKEVK